MARDLHALSKVITLCDIGSTFKTLPRNTIVLIEIKLGACFSAHNIISSTSGTLVTIPANYSFKISSVEAAMGREFALSETKGTLLYLTYLLVNCKG